MNVNEPRVPAGQSGGGQWTLGYSADPAKQNPGDLMHLSGPKPFPGSIETGPAGRHELIAPGTQLSQIVKQEHVNPVMNEVKEIHYTRSPGVPSARGTELSQRERALGLKSPL